MASVAFATVHGMGETLPDYADGLWAAVQDRLGVDAGNVAFGSVYYQQLLQDNEAQVWQRVSAKATVRYDELRRFVLFGFGDAAGLETRKEDDASMYELAQLDIARTLMGLRERCGGNVPLVLLAHSLGCQVMSSYIYDAQKARRTPVVAGIWKDIQRHAWSIAGRSLLTPEEIAFLRGDTCTAWITTGCNIPIFVAAHQNMRIIPIARPNERFDWLNIYDPDDVLGWPLQPLSDGYRELVEDRAINAGRGPVQWLVKSWNPWSHNIYWDSPEVLTALSDMLRRAAMPV